MCFHNKSRVFLEWIWYYFTFKRGVRLITDRTDCKHCEQEAKGVDEMLTLMDN
jgi:NADH dehydrogenase